MWRQRRQLLDSAGPRSTPSAGIVPPNLPNTFGNALGNSIVGAIQNTATEKRTAQINQQLDQENQQANQQINQQFDADQQEFSDQIGTEFDSQVEQSNQIAAIERDSMSGAEAGFSSPDLAGLVSQAANVKFNVADPAEFNFLQASQVMRRQQDTQAVAAAGSKSAEVQAALESGNYSEVMRLTDESLRQNDPIGYALANQSQLAPSTATRVLGGVQLAFGAIDVGIGLGLSSTGIGAVVGVPLAAYGADQYVAGSRSLVTGYGAESGLFQAAQFAGASPTVARDIEFGVGYALGFGGVGALSRTTAATPSFLTLQDFAALPERGTINPSVVRYSQDSIGDTFRKPFGSVDDFVSGLKNGEINPAGIEPIRMAERNGQIFTLDNRRLYAFQQAETDIPYVKLDSIPKRQLFKFTTVNEGVSIKVRRDGG